MLTNYDDVLDKPTECFFQGIYKLSDGGTYLLIFGKSS